MWSSVAQILPQLIAMLCNMTSFSVCPTESRYFVSFRDLTDLVCPECALLHILSLSGRDVPCTHKASALLSPFTSAKVALEQPRAGSAA